MFGNYKYNPKHPNALLESDTDNFIFCLLSDFLEDSGNLDLQNESKVDYAIMSSISLEGKKFLLSFQLDKNDPRNNDFLKNYKDQGNYVEVVYEIALLMQPDSQILDTETYYSGSDFKKVFETLILGLTDNHNGDETVVSAPNYKVTLDNGKTLSNALDLNKADDNALYFMSKINGNTGNYLTGSTNILFSIIKE
jgi:hypothetical protein